MCQPRTTGRRPLPATARCNLVLLLLRRVPDEPGARRVALVLVAGRRVERRPELVAVLLPRCEVAEHDRVLHRRERARVELGVIAIPTCRRRRAAVAELAAVDH